MFKQMSLCGFSFAAALALIHARATCPPGCTAIRSAARSRPHRLAAKANCSLRCPCPKY